MARRGHGEGSWREGLALSNLGNDFLDVGETEKAIDLEKRALAIDEKDLGPFHPYVAAAEADMAYAYSGEPARARRAAHPPRDRAPRRDARRRGHEQVLQRARRGLARREAARRGARVVRARDGGRQRDPLGQDSGAPRVARGDRERLRRDGEACLRDSLPRERACALRARGLGSTRRGRSSLSPERSTAFLRSARARERS